MRRRLRCGMCGEIVKDGVDSGTGWPRRRLGMRMNALADVALAAVLTIMLNFLAARHSFRRDMSGGRRHALSDRTRKTLERLDTPVEVSVFCRSGDDALPELRSLLREYERACPHLRVEYVDPDRDLARAKELAARLGVSEAGVVMFELRGRKRIVRTRDVAEYDYSPMLAGRPKRMTLFKGEQLVTAALQSLAQTNEPIVYMLSGHGERNPENFDDFAGYSRIARQMRMNRIQVRRLAMGSGSWSVPGDAAALIVAGPVRPYSAAEVEALGRYLDGGGRMMLLLDTTAGLEGLLENWGLRLAPQRVTGSAYPAGELIVREYGEHPITREMHDVTTVFFMPRAVLVLAGARGGSGGQDDRPAAAVLAASGPDSFATTNTTRIPPAFDPASDLRGPVAVAVAVERGSVPGVRMEVRPTRLVVMGDSSLVSNGALLRGHNTDLFVSSLIWLLDRDALPDIAPKRPEHYRIVISAQRMRMLFAVLVGGLPAGVCLVGLCVWLKRRR